MRWGVPLSPDEIAELDRRLKVRAAFQPLLELAIELPEYAGAYTDHDRGGLPILLTSNLEAFLSAIEASRQANVEFEIREVEYSLLELEAAQDLIDEATPDLRATGTQIVSTGLDILANRVQVGVHGLRADTQIVIFDAFGPIVTTVEDAPGEADACVSMNNCWPMKGGLRIHATVNGLPCTGGFIAARSDNGKLGIVTAGHCLAHANPSGPDYWGHANSPTAAQNFGEERLHTWHDGSLADVGFIVFDQETIDQLGAPNALHYLDPAGNGTVIAVQSNGSQLPNDAVCRMGWGTWDLTSGQGRTCGQVRSVIDQTRPSCLTATNCRDIKHQWEVNFDSVAGDSGGPVYHPYSTTTSIAYGTHVHSWEPALETGWYSPVLWGRTAYWSKSGATYSYDVCITGTC